MYFEQKHRQREANLFISLFLTNEGLWRETETETEKEGTSGGEGERKRARAKVRGGGKRTEYGRRKRQTRFLGLCCGVCLRGTAGKHTQGRETLKTLETSFVFVRLGLVVSDYGGRGKEK